MRAGLSDPGRAVSDMPSKGEQQDADHGPILHDPT
ncbi:hypothetical protein BJ928_105223 [Rhizobium sp. WW_1]|nr:hypothetical protein BJ928_105223 [Rhizobium sp. WW_1]